MAARTGRFWCRRSAERGSTPWWPQSRPSSPVARLTLDVALDLADGAGMSWLHRHAEVLARSTDPDGRLHVTIRVDPDQAGRVRAKFGDANIAGMRS